ncbi:S8 family peptidase, partial [Photobacterium phosphoreum]|uniref:S8 family peptidase n=1 Tax=Photobacterium phosphoreum TaxID=659 RepID=UPI001E46E672
MGLIEKGCALAALSVVALGAYAQTADDFITPEFERSKTLKLINAQYAYAAGYTGKGITIAVVDSGLDIHHPEFKGRVSAFMRNYLPGFDPDDVYSDLDPENHGTHVAGLAAAARDGKGMHGVAYNSEVLPLRTDFDDEQMVHVFDQAIRAGSKVLNGSYGPPLVWEADPTDINRLPSPYHPALPNVDEEYILIKRAADADVLLVYAAGNDRQNHPGAYTNIPSGVAMFPLITPTNTALRPDNKYFYRFLDELPNFAPATFLGDVDTDPEVWAAVQEYDFSSLTGGLIAVVATRPDGVISNYSNLCRAATRWCLAAPG